MRLADLFAEPMALALALAEPGCAAAFGEVRPRLEALLAQARTQALQQGYAAGDVDDAVFAFCAWADETVLGSEWNGREAWLGKPLQRVLFSTLKAGEEFYARLARLLPRAGGGYRRFPGLVEDSGREEPVPSLSQAAEDFCQDQDGEAVPPDGTEDRDRPLAREVLEIFALCLSLGFTGRYFLTQDRPWLQEVATLATRTTLGQGEDLPAGEELFPELQASRPVRDERRLFWRGVSGLDLTLILLPVLGAAFLYYSYNFLLSEYLRGFLGLQP